MNWFQMCAAVELAVCMIKQVVRGLVTNFTSLKVGLPSFQIYIEKEDMTN